MNDSYKTEQKPTEPLEAINASKQYEVIDPDLMGFDGKEGIDDDN